MATRIAGITIEIGGDTTKLQKALKGVDSQLKTTQNNLKDINKLLKLDPGNTELLTQKQQNLQKAISGTKDRLQQLKDAQGQVAKGTQEWDALQREIIDTEQQLKSLEKEYRNFGSVALQQISAVGQKLQEAGGKLTALGQKLTPISGAAAGLVTGLAGLGYKAVTAADDLNTLSKQTGLSTDSLQKMQYASDRVDVSVDTITSSVTRLKKNMAGAPDAFASLGVAVTDANGNMRDAESVFYDTLQALSKIENETERDALSMELFGKSAMEMAGIVDDGGAKLKALGEQNPAVARYYKSRGLYLGATSSGRIDADPLDETEARGDVTVPPVRLAWWTLRIRLTTLRETLTGRIEEWLPPEEAGVLEGMLVGDKTDIGPDTNTAFQRAGVLHLFAVSGFHVSLWTMLVYKILLHFGAGRKTASGGAILFLFLFVALTGFPRSAVRAGIMLGVFFLSRMFVRSSEPLNALGVAVLVIVLPNPFYAGDTGV